MIFRETSQSTYLPHISCNYESNPSLAFESSTSLWVQRYEFFGHEKGGTTREWPVGSTIAIVASQFDIDAYTQGFGGNVRAM
jgi:hypothetical protein